MKTTLRQKGWMALGAAMAVTSSALSVVSYANMGRPAPRAQIVRESLDPLQAMAREAARAEAAFAGFSVAGDSSDASEFQDAVRTMRGELEKMRPSFQDREQRWRAEIVSALLTDKSARMDEALRLSREAGLHASLSGADREKRGRFLRDVRRLIGDMARHELGR